MKNTGMPQIISAGVIHAMQLALWGSSPCESAGCTEAGLPGQPSSLVPRVPSPGLLDSVSCMLSQSQHGSILSPGSTAPGCTQAPVLEMLVTQLAWGCRNRKHHLIC